jgi:hypothetical protein
VKRLPENAKQAIGNAIKREAKSRKVRWSEAAEHILARTKAYAASEYVRSRMAAGHTVKHPKPWFDGGGYDEPDEEWARTWRVDGQRDGPSEGAGGGTGGGGGGGKPRTDYDAIEKNLLAKERVA